MIDSQGGDSSNAYWFVGANYGGRDDQMPRFLAEGIWENGYDDKYTDLVKSMQPGEKIAIKAAYTRKRGLDFNEHSHTVSVMAIKATGVITENLNDGKRVKVNWNTVEPLREWYFYTNRGTIWRVMPGGWERDALIEFTFEGKSQDISKFCNAPFWRERFGSRAATESRFPWTSFYVSIADKLLNYRRDRKTLIDELKKINEKVGGLGYLTEDLYIDGTKGFLRDICPFTVMGTFNRGITHANRVLIATELAKFLEVPESVPTAFDGIPLLNNLKSWYFPPEKDRAEDHIESLWEVFEQAIKFADDTGDEQYESFSEAFDNAMGRRGVAWNLTFGLYWIRPWTYPTLDSNTKAYLINKLGLQLGANGPKGRCSSADYLRLMETLESRFKESDYPVHSYPELSLQAWIHEDDEPDSLLLANNTSEEQGTEGKEESNMPSPLIPYTIDDIIREGCFLPRAEIDSLIERLRDKKNLILQGPPGTGKTWLAKKIAFALMGTEHKSNVRVVQFHPNLSYEDFVRGWRPTGDGKLALTDGIFMESIKLAIDNPKSEIVIVIEEINRGNPANIFGELLTLLEASKRNPNDALELCYPDANGKKLPVHIPKNLYVIGTMNIADRSLAMMDLALRRRFAFVTLEPMLGETWKEWVVNNRGLERAVADAIQLKLTELNKTISADPTLGKQFVIGHSFVTPSEELKLQGSIKWFEQVIQTEIKPLLEEYWFDAPGKVESALLMLKMS